ncbi:retinol dehydrogenase 12-like isoform X2 [Euwallacea similis]|uniref:retinol dehydrogenase 12-like isoform X2 n=1 Tax=Euwallacea similis TaxID=1736056 RepID=UPI00344D3787
MCALTPYLIFGLSVLIIIKIINKICCFWCKSKVYLVGKTAIVTGGASGIGFQIVSALASKGCRVIVADIANLEQAVEALKKTTHNPQIIGLKVDLESFKSVREFAHQILASESRLDILVCNAGTGDHMIRRITAEGLERIMQINYFSHFLLTHLLLDLLKKSAPSRITFTSSVIAYISDIKVDKLLPDPDYYESFWSKVTTGTYGGSKLCMAAAAILFGEKLKGSGVTANADLPYCVRTPIFWKSIKNDRNYLAALTLLAIQLYGKSAEEGAQTTIHLAHSDEVKDLTGNVFLDGMIFPRPRQITEEFCTKLWNYSVEYTQLQPHEVKC